MNNLNSDQLRELLDWMEDDRGAAFWKEIANKQDILINRLIECNSDEVRGRIKQLGEVAKLHDVALDLIKEKD